MKKVQLTVFEIYSKGVPTVQKSTHHLHVCVPNHLGQRSAAADANRGDVKKYENEGDQMRADFFSRLEKNTFFSLDMVSFSDVFDSLSKF